MHGDYFCLRYNNFIYYLVYNRILFNIPKTIFTLHSTWEEFTTNVSFRSEIQHLSGHFALESKKRNVSVSASEYCLCNYFRCLKPSR